MVFAFGVKQIIQREITQGGDLIFISWDLIGLKALRYNIIGYILFVWPQEHQQKNDFRDGESYYSIYFE